MNTHEGAKLIARYMEKTLTEEEGDQLDKFILASDENMLLFERLTAEHNYTWSKKWFRENGIRNKYFKQKRQKTEWYDMEPYSSRPQHRHYPVIMAVIITLLIFICALIDEWFIKRPDPQPFVFKEMTILQVGEQLSKTYKVQVHYSGVSQAKFSAAIPANYTLMEKLDTLQQILHVKISVKEQQIFITSK